MVVLSVQQSDFMKSIASPFDISKENSHTYLFEIQSHDVALHLIGHVGQQQWKLKITVWTGKQGQIK